MAKFNNAMEIFKLLEKTNCRECNEPTCLAFAAAVFRGQRQLSECPRIDKEIIERLGLNNQKTAYQEQDIDEALEILKRKISALDLPASAERVGGIFSDNRLTIKILGKDFSVDSKGNLSSDIHMHQWIVFPVLNYITESAGIPVTGKWVPLRELKSGQTW